jgi:hypothetical protein
MLGSTGNYVSPSSRILDPFANLAAPTVPAAAAAPFITHSSASPNYGCSIDAEPSGCTVLSPGLYVGGLNASGNKINGTNFGGGWIIFKPGLYYMRGGGFTLKTVNGGGGVATNYDAMCNGCAADTDTGTGMLVYDTGNCGGTPCVLNSNPTGGFQIDTNVQASLKGPTLTTVNASGNTVPAAPYYGILFWEDGTANAHTGSNKHGLGQGNGCFTLIGTIYATNSEATMLGDPTHYQEMAYNGSPCSSTVQQGYIITSVLETVGSTQIKMNLTPYGFLTIRQVALVR